MSGLRLLAAGGAHIDRRGRVAGPHVAEASNPGTMREEVGGGAFNAARAAVQRGVTVALVSLRGGDQAGETVAAAIEAAGIEDLSATFLDRTTPSYTAILTQEGDLVTGLADMALYEHGFARQMRRAGVRAAVAAADAILCDANMPADAIAQLVALAGERPVHAIAVSPAKAERLKPVLGALSCLFMNRREALHLAGETARTPLDAARCLARKGLHAGVITAGGGPALAFRQDAFFTLAPPPVARIADVTGAGDALAGATTAALMRGLAFPQAVREGMAAAKLAVESERAAPAMGAEAFRAALARVPQPQRA
ncbi:carbohydrate kinase family protein [Chelativorans intermedius]|uniref:Carbohydrate kinase family protein n=1 Tax=Chelativorans intermedius TaxID=515947 RepID=A0ABV6D3C5_9HYPH|nr:carbohydrate kinase family protein [Chelativorans intermedius]MCT8998382.1 carbohydrate kinase family protein [Chelativorans intermedius]